MEVSTNWRKCPTCGRELVPAVQLQDERFISGSASPRWFTPNDIMGCAIYFTTHRIFISKKSDIAALRAAPAALFGMVGIAGEHVINKGKFEDLFGAKTTISDLEQSAPWSMLKDEVDKIVITKPSGFKKGAINFIKKHGGDTITVRYEEPVADATTKFMDKYASRLIEK